MDLGYPKILSLFSVFSVSPCYLSIAFLYCDRVVRAGEWCDRTLQFKVE
jgi:hypothetical protein